VALAYSCESYSLLLYAMGLRVVQINAITAATEAACLVLSVDETIKNPKSESAQGEGAANAMAGRGRGGMAMRGRGGRGMRRR
jgi:T-complex protein 1 subunit eta